MKSGVRRAGWLAAAVLAGAVLTVAGPAHAENPAPQPAPATARPVVSEIVAGEAQRLRSFPGFVAATVETTLAFQTPGRISTRPVRAGDVVQTGDVIATLEEITLSEDVAAARAALAAVQAEAELARRSLARIAELNRRNVASAAQMEAATAQRDSAEARMAAAEADVERAEAAERFGTLRAPVDGVITSVLAEPGAAASPGMPVVTLASRAEREAVIDLPAEVLAILPPDARFVVAARQEGGAVVGGRLRLIEPVAGTATRSRRVRIALGDGARQLRLGALVTAALDMPVAPVITVPATAVLPSEGGPAVWRVGTGRAAQAVAVVLGPVIGDRVVVEKGLNTGDEIIIRGINSIAEGQILGSGVRP